MRFRIYLASILSLGVITACNPLEKQDPDPASQDRKLRSMLYMDRGDTILYWEFFYRGALLDSISAMDRNFFYTTYYCYLFRKSGDTTIIYRGDGDRNFSRVEAYLSDLQGYVKAYTKYDVDQVPYTTYIFTRNASGELDSVRSDTFNFLGFEYDGDFIQSYKTYYYTPPDGLVYALRNEVSYDPSRKRKEGLPVTLYSPYGSLFYTLDIHNFGKGSDKLVSSVMAYNPDGSLNNEVVYQYPVYTDTLVVCEPSGTVEYGTYTYRYY